MAIYTASCILGKGDYLGLLDVVLRRMQELPEK